MIAKALLYIGIFILIRAWMKMIFKKEEIPPRKTQKSFSQKDVFEADYKVVDDDK